MTKPHPLLGKLTADEFLANYWQKKPLLIRGAIPNFEPPIDGDDLAGLTTRSNMLCEGVNDTKCLVPIRLLVALELPHVISLGLVEACTPCPYTISGSEHTQTCFDDRYCCPEFEFTE